MWDLSAYLSCCSEWSARAPSLIPNHPRPAQGAWQTQGEHNKALGVRRAHTGVRPNKICGGFPDRTLLSSSSTMSWVISTCMAWMGRCLASLDPMSLSGAPWRAMPPVGRRAAAMVLFRASLSWRESDAAGLRTKRLSREMMHRESTQAQSR